MVGQEFREIRNNGQTGVFRCTIKGTESRQAIGIVISTAALVCVLSVFNGFVGIIEDSYSAFDSELQITAATGKVFDFTDVAHKVETVDNIAAVSYVLEDDALIAYYNSQTPFRMRGVDAAYSKVLDMDSMMMEGQFRLISSSAYFAEWLE